MPNKMLFALSKKHKIPVDELEHKWEKAKKIVLDEYGTIHGKYGVLMTIFKRMTNLGEAKLRFGEFLNLSEELPERLTVFHGFSQIEKAIDAVKYGLSGKSKVARDFSYEADNNPTGLFVTPELKIAKFFGDVVIQFEVETRELEAPVWPNGMFTGQNQKSEYFGRDRAGRIARNARIKFEDEDNLKNGRPSRLENSLFHFGENQALFIGHLNPSRISKIFIARRDDGIVWEEISAEDFLKEFGHKKEVSDWSNSAKLFAPDEDFAIDVFHVRLSSKFKFITAEKINDSVKRMLSGDDPRRQFENGMKKYLWPKQIFQAYKFFRKTLK